MSDTVFIAMFCSLTIMLDIVLYVQTVRSRREYYAAKKAYDRMKNYIEESMKILDRMSETLEGFTNEEPY